VTNNPLPPHHKETIVGYRLVFNKVLACLILGAMLSGPAMAASNNDFGSGWIPKPLVDPNASVTQPGKPVAAADAAGPADAELEKSLKPAEPFIRDVESKLLIRPKSGVSLVSRLNTVQTVLFGEAKYKDAGEVLAKMAELFPQEAAKAHAELTRQMNPPTAAATKPGKIMMMKGPSSSAQSFGNQGAGNFQSLPQTLPPAGANQKPVVTAPSPSSQVSSQTSPKNAPKDNPLPAQTKKRRFWQSDWDEDPFKNDPFFKDSFFNERSTNSPSLFQSSVQTTGQPPVQSSAQSYVQPPDQSPAQSSGSRLQGLGSGLLGLAALAGSVAGNYYANKKWGGVANNNQANQYPYGYAPYGQGYPYGYPYGAYPSGQVYGYGYPVYGQPAYSYGPAYTPYGSTTSAITPLGYPY
jgi:hypothetical protein